MLFGIWKYAAGRMITEVAQGPKAGKALPLPNSIYHNAIILETGWYPFTEPRYIAWYCTAHSSYGAAVLGQAAEKCNEGQHD